MGLWTYFGEYGSQMIKGDSLLAYISHRCVLVGKHKGGNIGGFKYN